MHFYPLSALPLTMQIIANPVRDIRQPISIIKKLEHRLLNTDREEGLKMP